MMPKAFIILGVLAVAQGAPQVPASARRTLFDEPTKDIPGPEKNYTGVRVNPQSNLTVYHNEQTIAVVELGSKRGLLNCELLEVKTAKDKKATLETLRTVASRSMKISFTNMKNLMEHCQKLEEPKSLDRRFITEPRSMPEEARGLTSIFSGVVPGTKWCGTGDIAGSYFDLGSEKSLDKCCRTHDLCPVKVSGFKTQYNITNYSPYTRSHCDCDLNFYKCLKKVQSTLAEVLGNIYFNVAQVTCVEDMRIEKRSSKVKRQWKISDKRF